MEHKSLLKYSLSSEKLREDKHAQSYKRGEEKQHKQQHPLCIRKREAEKAKKKNCSSFNGNSVKQATNHQHNGLFLLQ